MNILLNSRIAKVALTGASLLIACSAHASPIKQVLNGFELGMTKDAVMARVTNNGASASDVRCDKSDRNPRFETCWITPAFKPVKLYGHAVESMDVSFRDGLLVYASLSLELGEAASEKGEHKHRQLYERVLNKLNASMKGIKPETRPARIWMWKTDEATLELTARHMKNEQFPAPFGTYVDVNVFTNDYIDSLRAPAKAKNEGGWFSKMREKLKS